MDDLVRDKALQESSTEEVAASSNATSPVGFNITVKIVFLITILVVITTLVVSSWIFHRFNKELIENKKTELSVETELQGLRFKSRIKTLLEDVTFLSGTPPIQGIIRAKTNGDIDPLDGSSLELWETRLQTIFTRMLEAKSDYQQIRYIGIADNGRELIRVDRLGNDEAIRIVTANDLQQKGDARYFKNTTDNVAGQTLLSEIELNREHGEIIIPETPVIRASIPVFDQNNNLFGMIVINKDVSSISELLALSSSDSHRYYLTNGRGDYLIHPDPGKTFRFEYGESFMLQDEYPEFSKYFVREEEVEQNMIHEHKDGTLSVVDLRKVNYGTYGDDEIMGIIISEKIDNTLDPSIQVRNQAFLILALFIMITTIIGSIFIRRLTKPILKITKAVQDFSAGKANVILPLEAKDEAGVLANSFSDMIDMVKSREDKLKREVWEREKAEKQAKAVFQSAVDGIVTIDSHGTILSANPSTCRIFGYEQHELRGQNVKILMPDQYRKEHDGYLNDYHRTGIKKVIGLKRLVEGLTKEGKVIPIELSVSEVKVGDEQIFTGIVRDITEWKEAKDEIVRQKEYYESLIANLNIPAFVIDPNHKVVIWNKSLELITGLPASEVIGTDEHWRGFYPDNKRDCLCDLVLKKEFKDIKDLYEIDADHPFIVEGKRTQNWCPMPTGKNLYLNIDAGPIFDKEGNVIAVVEVIMDMTEEKLAADRLASKTKELQRSNEQLESFAYVASHDLQEPLRMVSSYTQLLEKRYKDKLDENAKEYIHFAVDGAKRMQTLIQDLLKYSRLSTGEQTLTEVDTNEMFDYATGNLEMAIEETDSVVTKDELPVVEGDEGQLRQLFQNLIGNAIKYHDPNKQNKVHVSAKEVSGGWQFCIADTGIGISPSYFDKIFVIFKRLHNAADYKGTGIGLALCKRIVEFHNGKIWVESEAEQGSRFYFTILKNDANERQLDNMENVA